MAGFVIHIIESPSANDLLDGRHEGAALQESLRLMEVSSERFLVVNEATLVEAIRRIAVLHEEGNAYAEHVPILHVSCHGYEKGIGLTSGEEVVWTRLADAIRPINAAAGNAMLVGMSTCKGYEAMNMAKTLTGGLPFGLLVGPTHDALWRDSLVAFITLYHRFTKKIPTTLEEFDALINAVNDATGLPRGAFRAAVAGVVQNDFKQSILAALRSPERQARMRTALEALQRTGRIPRTG